MATIFYFSSATATQVGRPADGVPLLDNTLITGAALTPTGTGATDLWNKAMPASMTNAVKPWTISVGIANDTYEFWGRFTSDYLAAQTIPSQMWRYQPFCGQGQSAAQTFHYPYLALYRPGVGIIQVFMDGTKRFAEWYASPNQNVDNQITLPSITTQNGDYFIVEIWSGQGNPSGVSMGPNTHTINVDSTTSWLQATVTTITFGTAPPMGPMGNLSQVETAETMSADATLTWAPRNLTATITEQAETVAGVAKTSIVADLTKIENADTLVGTAIFTPRNIDLSVIENADSLSAAGVVIPVRYGDLGLTENTEALTASGVTIIGVTANIQENADTADGIVKSSIEANFSIQENSDNVFSGTTVPAVASFTITEEQETLSGDVTVTAAAATIVADLNVAETSDTINSDASVEAAITSSGDLNKIENADSLSASAKSFVVATATIPEAADTLSTSVIAAAIGSLTKIENVESVDGLVGSSVIGDLTQTENPDTVEGIAKVTAVPPVVADLNVQEGADTLSATGTLTPISFVTATITESPDTVTTDVDAKASASLTNAENPDNINTSVTGVATGSFSRTEGIESVSGTAGGVATSNLTVQESADTLSGTGGTPSVGTRGILFEFSPDATVNNGAFAIKTLAARTYLGVKGTAAPTETDFTTVASDEPYVLTGLVDLGGPSVITRTNSVQADMDTNPLSGNLGAYKLYIGAGVGNVDPVQGRLYQLIIRGAFSNAAQVADIENFVAMKTGVDAPMVTTVEVMPGVIKRLNRRPQWYQFSPPPWIMLVLVTVCITMLLTGCAIAVNDQETEFYMKEVIEYLSQSPLI